MACGACAAAAARRNGTAWKWQWTDGTNVVVYDSEIAAKAKVMRKGGSYFRIETSTKGG